MADRMKTATFFEAMKSAFDHPGEWWWCRQGEFVYWMTAGSDFLCTNLSDYFIVCRDDLTATWTCDGSEP